MKYRDLVELVEADGWRHIRTTGSHPHDAHDDKPGLVTIAGGGKLNKDVPLGTLNNILRQAGFKGSSS